MIHRVLAGLALVAGLLAVFAGSPYVAKHGQIDVAELSAAVAHEEDHVTALELAAWIRDRKPGLRVIDLRYFLHGGINEWLDDVVNPNAPSQEAAALSRYFGGVPPISDVKRPNTATAVRRRGC